MQRKLTVGRDNALQTVHVASETVVTPVFSYPLLTTYAGPRGGGVAQAFLAKQLI